MNIIEVSNLSKIYKNKTQALNKISFKIKEGEIFSILGKNGAGKSSLIKILTGALIWDEGEVKILSLDLNKNSLEISKNIGLVSQAISLDNHLSLEENMIFQGNLYHVDKEEIKTRMEELINIFDLEEYRNLPVATYSGGIKRRLDIATIMMSQPKILFLDEPSVGMDILSRQAMWKMIQTIKDEYKTSIILTTHYLEEADYLSDRIMIMKDGRSLVCDSPKNLKNLLRPNLVELVFENFSMAESVKNLLDKDVFFKDKNIVIKDNSLSLSCDLNLLNRFLYENKIDFVSLARKEASLNDVFINYSRDCKEA